MRAKKDIFVIWNTHLAILNPSVGSLLFQYELREKMN